MTMNMQGVKATSSIAVLKNVSAMVVLMETLMARPVNVDLPGFGVVSGPTGYGKSMACTLCQNTFDAIYVQIQDHWTKSIFAKKMLEELGVGKPKGAAGDMWDHVIALVGDHRRPIIIDEADRLVDKGFIEWVRSLQDVTDVPVILVGEEMLPQKLERYERVYGRVLNWVLAEPCDLGDVAALAKVVVPKLTLAEDLLEAIRQKTGGRARLVATTLHEVAGFSRNSGLIELDLANYSGSYLTGIAPRRGRS